MFVTFSTEDGSFTERLDISLDMKVAELKGLLEAMTGIPAKTQVFVADGKELGTTGSLKNIGIKENSLVLIVRTKDRNQPPAQMTASNADLQTVMEVNKNPKRIVQIVQADQNLMRQANFYNKQLAKIFALPEAEAVKKLRKFMMLNSAALTMNTLNTHNIEKKMKDKLERDKDDPEAKKYFAEKERKQLVQDQYYQIMREYPESMTRVLMLYINVSINKKPVQAFVDSGAQTSVMSLRMAKALEIDHLVDERFATQLVGVGSAKSLGRIHLAPLMIEGSFFPLTITVLNDEKGLGDKNMDFLLGLDMLKRHRCSINLVKGVLTFQGAGGKFIDTPFLHEKDLPMTKGGTKDFDPNLKPENKE